MERVVSSVLKEDRNTERKTELKVVEEGGRSVINKSLKCMTLNAQSLRYKMEECSKYAEDYKSSLISVTETWGQEEIGMKYSILINTTCIEMIEKVEKGVVPYYT